MKPAILVAIGSLLVIAQEVTPLPGGWEWLERGGAIGILGFAVVWYMTRTIPAMQKDNRDLTAAHKEERGILVETHRVEREILATAQVVELDKFLERMDRWANGAREDSNKLNETLNAMTDHCKDVAATFGNQTKGE